MQKNRLKGRGLRQALTLLWKGVGLRALWETAFLLCRHQENDSGIRRWRMLQSSRLECTVLLLCLLKCISNLKD
jgi:hypothetical protein